MDRFYQQELETFRSDFIRMADEAGKVFADAITALTTGDADKARHVRAADDAIDALEVRIDAEGVRYLSLRAPVATDVRLITLALKASHDLERIGDEASSIAKRAIRITGLGSGRTDDFGLIPEMAEKALAQLRGAIDCLLKGDAAAALALAPKDKEIDAMHRKNYDDFLAKIEQNPSQAAVAMELVFISKSIERVGDHAINIAEEVVFLITGADVRHTDAVKRAVE